MSGEACNALEFCDIYAFKFDTNSGFGIASEVLYCLGYAGDIWD